MRQWIRAEVTAIDGILLSATGWVKVSGRMEKTWLSHYQAGVPPIIELDPEESLANLLDTACSNFGASPAFTNLGRTMTYGQLENLSARFAAYLQTVAGLERGDRVAVMMPNLLQYPVALFGILRAGMVAVNINPLYKPRELAEQLGDSGARAIVVAANSAATLAATIAGTSVEQVIVTEIGDLLGFPRRTIVNWVVRYIKRMVPKYQLDGAVSFSQVMNTPADRFRRENLRGVDLACLQYTGGTTGRSKGAMLSHGNLIANVRQINTWYASVVEPGRDIIITALPLYHVYALTCNCLCYLALGAHNILITDPRDTKGFINELKKWNFTAITGVNTLYQSLVDHSDFSGVDFSALNLVSAGGAALLENTANEWFSLTGKRILEGYGLSETSPVVCANQPGLQEFNGSIGLPLPSTEISLRDDRGTEVPKGDAGELCVRGPQVMAGYWNDAEATADLMTTDGFLKTGDIATMDEDGFFRIVDRKKDLILVSAFNVYPNEIENVITLHSDVMEAAAVGVPDEHSREAVKVFVVLRPGAECTSEELRAFCRERLSAYKVPKYVEFRSELPKSNIGKILRRELRNQTV